MSAQPTFTLCPPAAAKNAFFDRPQDRFFRPVLPVHLPDVDDEGTFHKGLSFDDYTRCQTQTHLGGYGDRRLGTPLWAMGEASTRQVLIAFFEASVVYHKCLY